MAAAARADVYGEKIKYRQDMPPPGGYKEILWHRTFPKTFWSASKLFGVWAATFGYGIFLFYIRMNKIRRWQLENIDSKIALTPFLVAERDRNWLRYLRWSRDEENKVMADVPGWQAGTWYGEPVYYTLDGQWRDPMKYEVYNHQKMAIWRRDEGFKYNDTYSGPHWWDKYLPEWFKDYNWLN